LVVVVVVSGVLFWRASQSAQQLQQRASRAANARKTVAAETDPAIRYAAAKPALMAALRGWPADEYE
jgi:hypothetical protein